MKKPDMKKLHIPKIEGITLRWLINIIGVIAVFFVVVFDKDIPELPCLEYAFSVINSADIKSYEFNKTGIFATCLIFVNFI